MENQLLDLRTPDSKSHANSKEKSNVVLKSPNSKRASSPTILGKDDDVVVPACKKKKTDVNPTQTVAALNNPETVHNNLSNGTELALAVRYWVECDMRESVNIPEEITQLLFLVVDNLREGDCLYDSCLNSDFFQRKKPKFGNDVSKLRNALQDFALRNHKLSEDIYLNFHDVHERAEMAKKLLLMALENDEWDDCEWFFEKLGNDKKFLYSINKKKKDICKVSAKGNTRIARKRRTLC